MESKDILFITLAVCAAVFTGFVAWFLFYLVKIFRTVTQTVDDFRDRLRTIDEILQTIHEKLTSTHSQLTAVATGLTQLVQWYVKRRSLRQSKKSTRASADEDES